MAPMKDIATSLIETKGDVNAAVEWLIKHKTTSAADMANRKADNNVVYSYVHNNKIGAMIVLACQTDFVAKNELFIQLAKDICMHICASPFIPKYMTEADVSPLDLGASRTMFESDVKNKPENIREKIITGKFNKWYDEVCLLRQKFIKNDELTIQQLKTEGGLSNKELAFLEFVIAQCPEPYGTMASNAILWKDRSAYTELKNKFPQIYS
jgi:elongation factor Ts